MKVEFTQAINLWKNAARNIIERERLMRKIESFEEVASNPDRFFKKGPEGSSEARMAEAREREDLMRQLHYLEARIMDFVYKIRSELNETVTLAGAPYLIKMKVDYLEMIQRLQQKRLRGEYKVSHSRRATEREKSANELQRSRSVNLVLRKAKDDTRSGSA